MQQRQETRDRRQETEAVCAVHYETWPCRLHPTHPLCILQRRKIFSE